MPTYQSCFETYTDLDYEFHDAPGKLNWITQDAVSNQINATLTRDIFVAKAGETIEVRIIAVDSSEPNRTNEEARFSIIICPGPPLLVEEWESLSIWEPAAYDDKLTWNLPTYQSCFESYTDLDYEFHDESGRLDWITLDSGINEFNATLSKDTFLAYAGSTIEVSIIAID